MGSQSRELELPRAPGLCETIPSSRGVTNSLVLARDGTAGWKHRSENPGSRGLSAETRPRGRAPSSCPGATANLELPTDVQTKLPLLPASILKAFTHYHWGKSSGKCQSGVFDCPGSVGEENLQPRTCQTRHEHMEYSRVFMSLGKERWKILPFAYSHHVLRTNEFGFSRKRLQINNHRRASGYSSSLGTGWLNSPFPAAGTPSGGAQPCHASGRLWWQFPAVPVLGCPSATSTLACIPPHPAELAPACKAPLGSLEG